MAKKGSTPKKGNGEYRIPARCHICSTDFLARYNVGKRAKTCTKPVHKCKRGTKNGRRISCLDGCCRSKYYRGLSQIGTSSSIDSRKFLNDKEFRLTVAATKRLENPKGIALRFIIETGCRLGESLLVRKKYLEWRDGPLSIIRMPTLKKSGRPIMPVHLDNHEDFAKELKKWAKKLKPDDVLFDVARRSLQRAFEKILNKIKPDRASLIHILRHTRASRLVKSGLDPNTIREEMRWSSIELLRVYSHTTEEEVAKALSNIRLKKSR